MMGAAGPPALGRENKPLTAVRGLAAMWVMACHVSTQFPDMLPTWLNGAMLSGYVGVDIFFVLSGFILAVVYRELRPDMVPLFWCKRLARVYPLNIVLMLVFAATARAGLPPDYWNDHAGQLPWYFAMLQSFMPVPQAAWIVASWSVGVEVTLYLLFPLVVALLRRLPPWLLLALTLALLAADLAVQRRYGTAMFAPGAFWRGAVEFLLGAALGTLAPLIARPGRAISAAGEGLMLLGIVAAVAAARLPLLPLFAGGLFVLLYFDCGPVSRALHWRPMLWQGEISYSLYLLHLPLLYYWAVYSATYHARLLWPPDLARHLPAWLALSVGFAAFFALVSVLASATWYLIERPGRGLPRLLGQLRSRRARQPARAG